MGAIWIVIYPDADKLEVESVEYGYAPVSTGKRKERKWQRIRIGDIGRTYISG